MHRGNRTNGGDYLSSYTSHTSHKATTNHPDAPRQRPVGGVDTTSPIAAQQSLEKAIDEANQATLARQPPGHLKAAHNHVSHVLKQCAGHLGLMNVSLLKKIHDYLLQEHHARGLTKWFHDYLDGYQADHLAQALTGGDLPTLEWLFDIRRGKLSAPQITQIRECAARHHQAACQSTDPHATLVAQQAQRLMGKTDAPMTRPGQRFGAPPVTVETKPQPIEPSPAEQYTLSDRMPTHERPPTGERLPLDKAATFVGPDPEHNRFGEPNLRPREPQEASAPKGSLTLKNDYYDLTTRQKSYADSLAETHAQQIGDTYGTAAKAVYQELTQFVAYLWTVHMNLLYKLESLLIEHKVQAPLNAGLTTLCLLWSEDQTTILKQFLDVVIRRTGDHPGLRQARELIVNADKRTGAAADQLYLLLNEGTPQDIVGLLRDNPWLPVALMKRAWNDPQYGRFIQQLHDLAGRWQGSENDKELQAWGAALQTLLPPAPMRWISAQDFTRRLVEAVKNQELAEIDFALATHKDELRGSLNTMALEDRRALVAVFTTLLKPRASNSLLRPGNEVQMAWLQRAGFKQMESHVPLLLNEVQDSIEAYPH